MGSPAPSIPPSPKKARRRRAWLAVGVVVTPLLIGAAIVGMAQPKASEADKGKSAEVAPVRTAPAGRRTLILRVEYRGELEAEVAELAAQATGRLDAVTVDIGDPVKAGALLARVDASRAVRQVVEAQAQVRGAGASLERVKSDLELARAEVARGERLAADGLTAARDLETLRARLRALEAEALSAQASTEQARARVGVLGQTVDETRLVAPFDGAVAERFLDPGALVQPGTRVLRLVRSGPLRVRVRVPERDLGRIAVGKGLTVTTQATGDRAFPGKVERIAAEVSRLDRTVAVDGVLDAETPELRPGMYAVVSLVLGELVNATVVPSEAIVERAEADRKLGVFVFDGGKAVFRALVVEGEADGLSAVKGKLSPGQPVITLGQHQLRDGAAVRPVEAGGP